MQENDRVCMYVRDIDYASFYDFYRILELFREHNPLSV
jgi:hypothetical protein